jgi:hypothetical protein
MPLSALLIMALFIMAAGCRRMDPYSYAPVSGDVLYEDGRPIQFSDMQLFFYPQVSPQAARTHPRPGWATLDAGTGRFARATTRTPGDGIVAGAHKVTLNTISRGSLPPDIVGPEYGDPATTPLMVDTKDQPFRLRVARPPSRDSRP